MCLTIKHDFTNFITNPICVDFFAEYTMGPEWAIKR